MKKFKTTGLCTPDKYYMVDISDKVNEIKKLIDSEEYFIINKPRQYGKTTTLVALKKELSKEYLVINISFEGIGSEAFKNSKDFCSTFIRLILRKIKLYDIQLFQKIEDKKQCINSFEKLSDCISEIINLLDKECILIIDEVDRSSNNEVFLDFLGMIRNKYLERAEGEDVTFKSVILAGVYDIKNLKLKLRNDEEKKYNSPWNIAVPFNIDMSLSVEGIQKMLSEYNNDKKLNINISKAAQFLEFYTSGYPFMVSRICQILDEDLQCSWNEDNMIKAIKMFLLEKNTLFDDFVKNIENNKELKEFLYNIVMNGLSITYNIYDPLINLAHTFGYCKNDNNKVKISNRVFEQFLYDYFSVNKERTSKVGDYNFKDDFIQSDGLNIEKILLRFQQFIKEQYSTLDSKFIEREGRLLFLAFIKPIINGVGFDFKEVQVSEEKRLDVVITYNSHKYIIELKIWRGEKYHKEGLKQLEKYLEINEQNKGYLLVFNFNKTKEYKNEQIIIGKKKIFQVFL